MKLILYSKADIAGANIAANMREKYGFREDGQVLGFPACKSGDILMLEAEESVRDLVSLALTPQVCVVASRHRSAAAQPSLTAHPSGNFGAAQLGGAPSRLQMTSSSYLRQAILLLRKKKDELSLNHEVTREVTHHGPTDLPFPMLFVEVGSSEIEWRNQAVCGAVAEVIYELLTEDTETKQSVVGFGGPHYAPNFGPLEEGYAIGHIMPKYAGEHLSEDMVSQMLSKTTPQPEFAAIDWKGFKGAEKERLINLLGQAGLRWEKTTDLK